MYFDQPLFQHLLCLMDYVLTQSTDEVTQLLEKPGNQAADAPRTT